MWSTKSVRYLHTRAAETEMQRVSVPTVTNTAALTRYRRTSRWSAPLSALGSLVILGNAYLYYGYGPMTFLKEPYTESPAVARDYLIASHHASGVADGVLLFATMLVVIAGVRGAVRPRRGMATAILTVSVLAVVAIQVAIRADIHVLNLYRR